MGKASSSGAEVLAIEHVGARAAQRMVELISDGLQMLPARPAVESRFRAANAFQAGLLAQFASNALISSMEEPSLAGTSRQRRGW